MGGGEGTEGGVCLVALYFFSFIFLATLSKAATPCHHKVAATAGTYIYITYIYIYVYISPLFLTLQCSSWTCCGPVWLILSISVFFSERIM